MYGIHMCVYLCYNTLKQSHFSKCTVVVNEWVTRFAKTFQPKIEISN